MLLCLVVVVGSHGGVGHRAVGVVLVVRQAWCRLGRDGRGCVAPFLWPRVAIVRMGTLGCAVGGLSGLLCLVWSRCPPYWCLFRQSGLGGVAWGGRQGWEGVEVGHFPPAVSGSAAVSARWEELVGKGEPLALWGEPWVWPYAPELGGGCGLCTVIRHPCGLSSKRKASPSTMKRELGSRSSRAGACVMVRSQVLGVSRGAWRPRVPRLKTGAVARVPTVPR